MNIFQRFRKKSGEVLLTNEDWKFLASMLFRYVNRDQNINPIVYKTDYITKAYLYNATIYAIISLRANAAKGVPWLVYKVKNSQKFREYRNITHKDLNLQKTLVLKEQALEEIEKGPINNLIKKPNPYMSFADIIEGLFVYRDVTGDAYLFHVDNLSTREILQLHLLPADRTKIVGGTFLDPISGYRVDTVFDEPLLPEKVMHWKYFNPYWDADGKQLYGISPLVSATRMINADNEGINNEAASFANEGVKGILTGTEQTEINFTPEQADTLIKKLKKATERAKLGEGNIAFNRAPMNYLKIGETPVNLGVLDSRKYNKEIFCNIFRIHPALLSSDASTLDNLKEARKSLMTLSVMPDLDSLRENLNDMIRGAFGEEWFVDYDIMAISELQEDIEKLGKTLQLMDWITINEKRAATNYDAYKDKNADILFTDMAKVPLGYGMDSSFEKIDEEIEKRRKEYKSQRDTVNWREVYANRGATWTNDLQPSKCAQDFAEKLIDAGKKSILEIGCGNGKDSILFAIAGLKVTSIDIIPDAIKMAKENAEKAKVEIDFQEGNAEKLSFDDLSFDAIYSLSVLHSTNIKKSMSEIARVVKKKGMILIYIYSNVQKIDGTFKEFVSIDEFIGLFKFNDLTIEDIYTKQEEEYDEAGEKHFIIIIEAIKK